MNKYLTSLIILVCSLYNLSFSNNINSFLDWEKTPNDTLIKLADYNVDSILDNLDYEINRADSFIHANQEYLNYEEYLIIGAIESKYDIYYEKPIEYNKLDTLGFISIFDTCIGSSYKESITNFDYISENKIDLYKIFIENINYKSTKHSLICFCDYYNNAQIEKKAFDYLLKNNKSDDLKILENYYLLVEYINKSCSEENLTYYKKLKEDYFNDQIIPLLFNKKSIEVQEDSSSLKYQVLLPMRAIAYALYGNDISISNIGIQYNFIIDSAAPSGGYSNHFQHNFEGEYFLQAEIESTIYGLWSLLQIKEQLVDYKKKLEEKEHKLENKKK